MRPKSEVRKTRMRPFRKLLVMHRRSFLLRGLGMLPVAGVTWAVTRSSSQAPAQELPEVEDILRNLRPGHPRLYLLDPDLPRLQTLLQQDPDARRWYQDLQGRANKMLSEPVVEHKLIGPRLLNQSQIALRRVSTLAFLYRLDGDTRKASRARADLLAAAAFPDWNPTHFLDTAEMTHAMAIGYDWLYHFLSANERSVIRKAILEKGLQMGLLNFKFRGWWTETNNNWNLVCNGGLTLGALAIGDEAPEVAREIITYSRASIVLGLRSFAPDGGWVEGPGYWEYATSYVAYYFAGLATSLSTDFGLSTMPGIADTGLFRIHSVGPLGLPFNFADAKPRAGPTPQMVWLASTFHRPLYAQYERQMADDTPNIFHLLWLTEKEAARQVPHPTCDAIFRGVNITFFRSAWDDPNAVFVGFKGGDNGANHSHLDLGTFVIDALGQRWALDLGPDNYDLPGYFGKLRYTYYRLRTEAHNTLTLANRNQNTTAKAPLLGFLTTPERAFAVADLTAGYTPTLRRAWRGVALLARRQVLVQDELEAAEPVEIIWNFHTRANIELHNSRAMLRQGSAVMEARILAPEEARFDIVSANPPPPQTQQPDVRNLVIRLQHVNASVRIAVVLTPGGGSTEAPRIDPLDTWLSAGKLKE